MTTINHNLIKIKDICKKDCKIFLTVLIFTPLFLLGIYLVFPNSYSASLELQLKSSGQFSPESADLKILILDSFKDPKYFSPDEINYFQNHFAGKADGTNPFNIFFTDSKGSRLFSFLVDSSKRLEEKFGFFTADELLKEKSDLTNSVAANTQDKTNLETSFQTLDEEKFTQEKIKLEAQLAEINNQISVKMQQISIIDSKLAAEKGNKRSDNFRIFKNKEDVLFSEVEQLKTAKAPMEERYTIVKETLENIDKTVTRIVKLEKSIDENSKKLALLDTVGQGQSQGLIKIPYLTQIHTIQPIAKPVKIYTQSDIKQWILIGLIFSIFVMIGIIIYHFGFNPVVSTIEELENCAGVPVLGAIYKSKKSRK